ncbi:MAG: ISAzo13-like element transposase-related protein [Terriglobia bacterium]
MTAAADEVFPAHQPDTAHYPTGVKVSQQQLAELYIRPKRILPKWNYTILPPM